MALSNKILPHYTYEDYCRWEGQWELIDGIPYAMSPLPSVKHHHVSGNLYMLFREALKKSACNCKVFMPIDYKVSEETILQPDLLITFKNILDQKFIAEPPELVVEILSSSTALKDLNSKFHIYQNNRIPYYLILDPVKNLIEVFELDGDSYSKRISGTNESFLFSFKNECSFEIDFSQVWIL